MYEMYDGEMHIRDYFQFIFIHYSPCGLEARQQLVSMEPCGVHYKAQLASFICADLQGGEGRVSAHDRRRADTRSRRPWANRKSDFASDILSEWFLSVNSWMAEIRF